MEPQQYYVEVDKEGNVHWYRDPARKVLHREGGPAVELASGIKYYFKDDKIHRVGGPAIEHSAGLRVYCIEGTRHRLDGPAIEYASGKKRWFIEGIEYSEEQFIEATKPKPQKKPSYTINSDGGDVGVAFDKFSTLIDENFDNIKLEKLSVSRNNITDRLIVRLELTPKLF